MISNILIRGMKYFPLIVFGLFTQAVLGSNPVLSVSTIKHATCYGDNNGSISLIATGGQSGYSYTLNGVTNNNGVFNSLSAGSYKGYVKDQLDSMDSVTVVVLNPLKLSTAVSITKPTCAYSQDGSMTALANGGRGPKTYLWTDTLGYSRSNAIANFLLPGSYTIRVNDSVGCIKDSTITLVESLVLNVSIGKTDISCNSLTDGKAAVVILSNGIGFSRVWTGPNGFTSSSAQISNLNQGYYSVKVTETVTGCSAFANSVIVMPTKLTVGIGKVTNALCFNSADGTISTNSSGGRSPYSYTWSGPNGYFAATANITNAKSGSYTVIVTDSSGCIGSTGASVTQPTQLSVIQSITDLRCYGYSIGEIDLATSGGTTPYQYSWSNSATTKKVTQLAAGQYSVTISDSNGCFITRTYGISTPTELELTYNSADIKCYGQTTGSVTLLAAGGTFPWTYGVVGPNGYTSSVVSNKNLSAGTYKIYLTDNNNCKDSETVVITQPNELIVTKSAVQPSCFGLKGSFSIAVSGGTSPFSYEWLDSSGSLYAATQNVVSVDIGRYRYTVVDANQCSQTDTLAIYQPKPRSFKVKSIQRPVCMDDATGSISLAASGGIKPYNFEINGSTIQSDSTFNGLLPNKYTFKLIDKNQCIDTITTTLLNNDTIKPVVILKNHTAYLNNNGQVNISVTDVNNGITDNCEVSSTSLSKSTFNCSNLGNNTVNVTAVDFNGNSSTVSTTVTILDTISPTLSSRSVSIYLSPAGTASLIPSTMNSGSFDNCQIDSFLANKLSFSCSDLGTNAVLFTIKDQSGNASSSLVNVNVIDTIIPTLKYKNITVYLNSSGSISITPADVDNGSDDNCAITKYEISQSSFNCNNIGANFITYKIYDKAQNINTQTIRVTVLDTFKPVSKVISPTVYLNQYGFAILSVADVDNGSYDNCRISTRTISQTVFTCDDLGNSFINFNLADPSGNTQITQIVVIVKDTIAPRNRVRNTSAYLDKNASAYLSIADVDNGTSDNCAVSKVTLSKDLFVCSDLGKRTIQFTSYDKSGNSTVTNIDINVLDTVKPVLRASNRVIFLDSTGNFTVTPAYFDDGSFDNCKITKRTLTQYQFSCADIGNRLLLYTIEDTSGNTSLKVLNIQVYDTLTPKIFSQNQTVYLDTNGVASISTNLFAAKCTDNCSISKLYFTDSIFTCSELGQRKVDLIAIDPSGNAIAKSFIVTVLDTISPVITTKPVVIYIDTSGTAKLAVNQVLQSIRDNCKIDQAYLDKYEFFVPDIGQNFVTVYAFDPTGNRSKNYLAEVMVEVGDQDKDSIPDYVERALDFDGDGVPNYLDKDSDNDGIFDVLENSGLIVLLDLDQDGFANVYDYDTDGDGILDIVEVFGFDPDLNGRIGLGKVAVNNQGIPVLANSGDGYEEQFTDNDNVPDYKDVDSDNDLISDRIENRGKSELIDSDGDLIPNYRDTDADSDGINDIIETDKDSDDDGLGNYIDYDSDNDEIPDLIETADDFDNDGFGNWLDLDSDDDGMLDELEGDLDSDKDGSGNWLDDDADNDGIIDRIEGTVDTDSDGKPDFLDSDSDNDLIQDIDEGLPFAFGEPADSDGDGIFDYKDLDSDNDGISDYSEGFPNIPDTDIDGIPDYRDTDSDNDGVLDFQESIKDTDNDGLIDAIDPDSDNDGILDVVESYSDLDGDGVPNSLDLDSDNDGINDIKEAGGTDENGTGIAKQGEVLVAVNTDNDGIFNFMDIDSDNDGISDLIESGFGFTDNNLDGRVDGVDTDLDGIQDEADGVSGRYGDLNDGDVLDSDVDGTRDFEDTDSDDDGIDDIIETGADFDEDGIANFIDDDSDNDEIPDVIETDADFDNDGKGNFIDLDSDGDGIEDLIETDFDYDLDGAANYLDLDSDGDEMSDASEGVSDKEKNTFKDFVDPQLFVPEIFTPNNDGTNDLLFIKGLINYPNASITVFNQWGMIVYDSKGPYKNTWNGCNTEGKNFTKDVVLPEGIYFYIVHHNRSDAPQFNKAPIKGNVYIKP